MTAKDTAKDTVYSVEQLKKNRNIPDAVHTGTCTLMGWCSGKTVTEKEYMAAVERFKKAAAGRKNNA